ncbi:MAG: O-antigen ligase family protein [Vicinamibacterales bacterium]
MPLLSLAGAAALAAPRRTLATHRVHRRIDWCLIVLAGSLLLQVVPLPRLVVALISPRSGAVQEALSFARFGNAPGWLTLSIDRDSTLESLATFILAVVTFWVARAVFTRRGTRRFCQVLAVIGGTAALVAIVQRAVLPGMVLGLLRPEVPSASPFGAFVNRNHFGGWLIMIASPVAGYLIAHAHVHPQYRRGWGAALREALNTGSLLTSLAALIAVGTIFLTLSRSALAGMAAGAAGGWWLVRSRLRLGRQGAPLLFAAGAIFILALGFFFVDAERWAGRINSSFDQTAGSGGRLTIWRETLPVIRDFPLTGTGAGTYSDAMTVYQQSRIWVGSMGKWTHFNSAHSHYLQLAAEGGLLLTLPAIVAVWSLVVAGRRALAADPTQIFWVRAGAAAGLLGLAVQSVWEVPLVMPANAVMAAVLAGLVVHEPHDRGAADGRSRYAATSGTN